MKYVDRSLKGTFGYIKKQTVFEIIKTVILYAMAFGIFFIGIATLHTRKSLWSVFAVLALLPACKSLVGVIMLLRFRSLSDDEHERYASVTNNAATLYENIITTREKTFFVPVIFVAKGSVICYCADPASRNGDLQTHMEIVLKAAGHKTSFHVFKEEKPFLKRAAEMSEKDENVSSEQLAVMETVKAVSL